MTSSNVLLLPGRAFDIVSHYPNFMVIGLQIGKLHRGGEADGIRPPVRFTSSEKPGLFRVVHLRESYSDLNKTYRPKQLVIMVEVSLG